MKVPRDEAVTGHPDVGVATIASRHPAVGLAVGVVRGGRLSFFHGHGLADIAAHTPVTEDTVFRIGSIVAAAATVPAVRRHRQYAPLRARGRALAAAATAATRPAAAPCPPAS